MKRLKIILNCNKFYFILLSFVLIYCLITTKLICYESKYNLNDNFLNGKIIDYNIDGNKLDLVLYGKELVKAIYYINDDTEKIYIQNNIKLGIKLKLSGVFNAPKNNTIPNNFNYKNYLYNKKIYKIFNIDFYEFSDKSNVFYRIKNMIIKKNNDTNELSQYLKTFILGDKRELDSSVYSNFQINGISHLFAISGMHISIFSALLFYILKLFKIQEKKSFAIVFLFLSFYAFLTSFLASIVRALVFMLFLNLNKFMHLNLSNIKCLLLSISSILFFKPFMLYDLGFQYSSVTVMGILISKDFITGNYIEKVFRVSLIAFIFSLPITIHNFYEINLLSPIINVLLVPFVSFVLYPLILLNFIFTFFTPVTLFILEILTFINNFFASLSFSIINIAKISLLVIFIYYCSLIIYFITKRKIFLLVIVFLTIYCKFIPLMDSSSYVYYLDVGQGDSILLIGKNRNSVTLVDTGGSINFKSEEWQQSKRKFIDISNTILFMKSLGIKYINNLIITHGGMWLVSRIT